MEGKSGKNDMTDAAAICEAASRPSMRFVPVKTCEQQGVMSLHRVREGLKEERTGCINQIRGVLAGARGAESIAHGLNKLLGTAWDAELEPYRHAGEGAPATWLTQVS